MVCALEGGGADQSSFMGRRANHVVKLCLLLCDNFVCCCVIRLVLNMASTWANQIWGLAGQTGGNFSDTGETEDTGLVESVSTAA